MMLLGMLAGCVTGWVTAFSAVTSLWIAPVSAATTLSIAAVGLLFPQPESFQDQSA
jgi:hypothetical protein